MVKKPYASANQVGGPSHFYEREVRETGDVESLHEGGKAIGCQIQCFLFHEKQSNNVCLKDIHILELLCFMELKPTTMGFGS